MMDEVDNRKVEPTTQMEESKQKKKANQFEHSLKLTEEFTAQLGLAELFRLSELQLQLEKCSTQFAVIYTIGTSAFY